MNGSTFFKNNDFLKFAISLRLVLRYDNMQAIWIFSVGGGGFYYDDTASYPSYSRHGSLTENNLGVTPSQQMRPMTSGGGWDNEAGGGGMFMKRGSSLAARRSPAHLDKRDSFSSDLSGEIRPNSAAAATANTSRHHSSRRSVSPSQIQISQFF